MGRITSILAVVLFVLWSLFVLAAYGTVSLGGGFLARNADAVSSDPGTVETLFRVVDGVKTFGLAALVALWAAVSAGIGALAWLSRRFFGAPRRRAVYDR